MTLMRALEIIDGNCDPLSDPETQRAWQYVLDHDHVWTLPGRYGRMAAALLSVGILTR